MINFLRKYAKLIFIIAILVFAAIAYLNFGLHKWFGIGCQPDPWPEPDVVVNDWSKPLHESGYKPAEFSKPEYIGEDKFPESVESVLYAGGTVQDSVAVEVSVVETPEGTVWVKATVDGEQVKWQKIAYSQVRKPVCEHDWSIIACGQFADGLDFAAGVSWEPLQFLGARAGLSVIVDVNETITEAPDWIALSARLSRRMGAFSFGADVGYSMGERRGLAVGIDCGVTLGL